MTEQLLDINKSETIESAINNIETQEVNPAEFEQGLLKEDEAKYDPETIAKTGYVKVFPQFVQILNDLTSASLKRALLGIVAVTTEQEPTYKTVEEQNLVGALRFLLQCRTILLMSEDMKQLEQKALEEQPPKQEAVEIVSEI
jgi:hypothetical protein